MGGNWGTKKCKKLFQLPLNFEDLIEDSIFRAEDQDENPEELLRHPAARHLLLTDSEQSFMSHRVSQ